MLLQSIISRNTASITIPDSVTSISSGAFNSR